MRTYNNANPWARFDGNEGFYRVFREQTPQRQAEILRDTARFFREERATPQAIKQADDLEHEAHLIENWDAITRGTI
jgi:hypothetical protein